MDRKEGRQLTKELTAGAPEGLRAELQGELVVFLGGPFGEHALSLECSSEERVRAHWGGYCEVAQQKGAPERALPRLGWGLADAVPPGARAAWGARAIARKGEVDVLRDRMDVVGEPADRRELLDRLNKGALRDALAQWSRLWRDGVVQGSAALRVHLHSRDGITVAADARGSCGYVYLAAWLV